MLFAPLACRDAIRLIQVGLDLTRGGSLLDSGDISFRDHVPTSHVFGQALVHTRFVTVGVGAH